MAEKRYKFPQIGHLPWSKGRTSDDIEFDISNFSKKHVTISEKLDGENTTLYRDGLHARSINGRYYPSQSIVRALHGSIGSKIPEGWRIVGENMYAKHSIYYTCLESYFYVIAIFDNKNTCLSVWDTEKLCAELGLNFIPLIYSAPWECMENDTPEEWEEFYTGCLHSCHETEGYVIRNSGSFSYEEFGLNVGKYVRENHVQTSEHWRNQPITRNLVRM